MTSTTTITGTYTRHDLDRLSYPIAWSGAPDREYESALAELVRDARETLDECRDAVAVDIEAGKIVGTVCE